MIRKINTDPVLRDLFAVATVAEVSQRWEKHKNTVLWAIVEGKLDARKTPNGWLITVESVIRLWGQPKARPDFSTVQLTLPMWRRRSA